MHFFSVKPVSLQAALTKFYHADSLVDIVRLGSLIDNILLKALNNVHILVLPIYAGLQTTCMLKMSMCWMQMKNVLAFGEREKALVGLHVQGQGQGKSVSLHMYWYSVK